MTSQLEEGVVNAHFGQVQQLGEKSTDLRLDRVPGRHPGGAGFFRRWRQGLEGIAVDFAVGCERHGGQRHEGRRHHVVGQCVFEKTAQLGRRRFFSPHLEIGTEAGISRHVFAHHHQRHFHLRMAGQRRFDFSQLDAETAQLDLMIDAAKVFQLTVRSLTDAVPRAVDAGTRNAALGIGQIAFGGGRRPFQIPARNARASQIQLADLPQRQRLQLGVQHVTLRAADRHTDGRLFRHVPGHQNPGRIGSVFRRSVKVVDLVSASFVDLVRQGPFERLASQIDGEHPRWQATFPHDFGDRRRHRIDQGHQIARRMAAQM